MIAGCRWCWIRILRRLALPLVPRRMLLARLREPQRRPPQKSPRGPRDTAGKLFERAIRWREPGLAFFGDGCGDDFRTAGISTPLAAASENIFPILRHLALAKPLPPDPEGTLITDLALAPELFKIIITSQSHGSIPASIWFSSYVIFLDDLQ